MCGSMVDIQSATAKIRRAKKRKKKKETTGQKYNNYIHQNSSFHPCLELFSAESENNGIFTDLVTLVQLH